MFEVTLVTRMPNGDYFEDEVYDFLNFQKATKFFKFCKEDTEKFANTMKVTITLTENGKMLNKWAYNTALWLY